MAGFWTVRVAPYGYTNDRELREVVECMSDDDVMKNIPDLSAAVVAMVSWGVVCPGTGFPAACEISLLRTPLVMRASLGWKNL